MATMPRWKIKAIDRNREVIQVLSKYNKGDIYIPRETVLLERK